MIEPRNRLFERTQYRLQLLSGANDVARMRELLDLFSIAFEDTANYQEHRPADAYLRAFLERDESIILAALAGETVAGGLVAYVLPKFEQVRKEVYIYDLAVATAHRRRGVATALIGALRRISADIGADVVFVQADRQDDAAIALYESLGTRREVLHFTFDVPEDHR